jgi:hypothetical protein
MTVDKQVAGLLKRYLNYDYKDSIHKFVFKDLASKLNLFPLSLTKITSLVERQGYALVYEPVLVYDKDNQHARLTMNPKKGEQVITKLSFDPVLYNTVLSGCELKGFFTSGLVITINHGSYTAYCNLLVIANNVETLKTVKNKYNELR